MNGEALETESCDLPTASGPRAQNQLLAGPGDMSVECQSLLSPATDHNSVTPPMNSCVQLLRNEPRVSHTPATVRLPSATKA